MVKQTPVGIQLKTFPPRGTSMHMTFPGSGGKALQRGLHTTHMHT